MDRKTGSPLRTAGRTALLMACFALLAAGFLWRLGRGIALADSQPARYLPAWLTWAQVIALPVCMLGFVTAVVAGMVLARRPRLTAALQIGCLVLALALGGLLAASVLTNPLQDHRIDITVPAGSTAAVYSDTEVCPRQSTVYVRPGEGLGDAEAVLTPVDGGETVSAYITPGIQMGLKVEKGAWYRVGLTMQNDTDRPVQVSVILRGVQVRIE
ncbi:hypothetical protein B5F36_05125 [Anaerofilum sp. An201]|nr:hypothetical protein [Anaerofilum sp. An201]OUP04275.1 hypothetical protein B5F36_05125 [Anaerofilum sp. An201]